MIIRYIGVNEQLHQEEIMMSPKTNLTTRLVLAILLLATLCTAVVGKTIYVDENAIGANDGSSWENAYNYLQDTLADANSAEKPVEIWVAQGTYTPDSNSTVPDGTGEREATFQLINGVSIYGGFPSGGAEFGDRDPNLNVTILSGDLNGDDVEVAYPCDLVDEPTRAENSYHVVTASGTDETAVLDGFTITAGNADATAPSSRGGGMYNDAGSLTVANCTFTGNRASSGGGMHNYESRPTLSNCIFSGNDAYYGGGGMMNFYNGSPILTNCTFSENSAEWGGGIHNLWDCNPTLTNCTFSRNLANDDGGGILNEENSNPNIKNCVFNSNSAYGNNGGGMYNLNLSNPTVLDCRFNMNWANFGGGMANTFQSNPFLSNCTFTANRTNGGGGMGNLWNSSPTLTNCTFSGNVGVYEGGGMDNSESSATLTNCIFVGNSAPDVGGVYNSWDESCTLINCILWGNASPQLAGEAVVTYSNIQGGWPGEGNIDLDPCFAEPGYWDSNGTPDDANDDVWVGGDYHLKSQAGRWDQNSQSWVKDDVTSSCIDAGDPNSPWQEELWPHGKRINMGAFGGTAEASMSLSDAGSRADCNNDDSVDVRDLMILCKDWLSGGQPTAADINRDSVVNFHDFALLAANWLQDISEGGLVVHWKLDETHGDIAYDSAGNNDATVHNGVWDEGRINGALQFNGFNTYMDCGDSEALGPEQMTFTMWLRPEHTGGMRYIVSRANKNVDETDYALMRHLTGQLEFAVGQLGSDAVSVLSIAQTPLNEWSHVAVCLKGSEASIYMNGQWDASANYAQRVPREGHRLAISSYQGSTRFYNGKIDDVRIYNQALSAEEIETLAR